MVANESLAIFLGAVLLGVVHGAEPGHGWPIAATYALNRSNPWWNGLVASSLLGLGHLVSSLAVVAVFFLAKSYFDLTQLDAPLTVGGVQIGGPVSLLAGVLLILLGIREYRHGHTHDHDRGHDHEDHAHDHDHLSPGEGDSRGLFGIVWTAFVLGFAHEEEFEIVGLCLGSDRCLALMLTYALAVLVALVGLTMMLIAGYQQYEARLQRLAEHFPLISAAVLVGMGVGFILGVF